MEGVNMKKYNFFFVVAVLLTLSSKLLCSEFQVRESAQASSDIYSTPFGFLISVDELKYRVKEKFSLLSFERVMPSEVAAHDERMQLAAAREIMRNRLEMIVRGKTFQDSYKAADLTKKARESFVKALEKIEQFYQKLPPEFYEQDLSGRNPMLALTKLSYDSCLQDVIRLLFIIEEGWRLALSKEYLNPSLKDIDGLFVDKAVEVLPTLDQTSVEFLTLNNFITLSNKALDYIRSVDDIEFVQDETVNDWLHYCREKIDSLEPKSEVKKYGELVYYFIHQAQVFKKQLVLLVMLEATSKSFIEKEQEGFFKGDRSSLKELIALLLGMAGKSLYSPTIRPDYILEQKGDSENPSLREWTCNDFLKQMYDKTYLLLDSHYPNGLVAARGEGGDVKTTLYMPYKLGEAFITQEQIDARDEYYRQQQLRVGDKFVQEIEQESLLKSKNKKKKERKKKKKAAAAAQKEVGIEQQEDSLGEDEQQEAQAGFDSLSIKEKQAQPKEPQKDSSPRLEIGLIYTKTIKDWASNPQLILERDGYLSDEGLSQQQKDHRAVFLEYQELFGTPEKSAQIIINNHTVPSVLDRFLMTRFVNSRLAQGDEYMQVPLLRKNGDGSFDSGWYEIAYTTVKEGLIKIYHKVFKAFPRKRIRDAASKKIEEFMTQEKLASDSGSLERSEGSGPESEWEPVSGEWIQESFATEGIHLRHHENGVEYYYIP